MAERIPVHVRGFDPILVSGISAQLRGRPEVTLVETAAEQTVPVMVVVVDTVDEQALGLVRELRAVGAQKARVLLVLPTVDDNALLAAVEAGVCGVVSRSEATPERLVTAVGQAAATGGVLSPRLVGRLLEQVSRLQNQVLTPRGMRLSGLSGRETDVLRLMSQGMEIREIAEKLSYSERTIKNTVHDVLNRFELRNRAHAVAFAMREGLI
jgi:DNA-binding NarL/FixJ family response regulator